MYWNLYNLLMMKEPFSGLTYLSVSQIGQWEHPKTTYIGYIIMRIYCQIFSLVTEPVIC